MGREPVGLLASGEVERLSQDSGLRALQTRCLDLARPLSSGDEWGMGAASGQDLEESDK